MSEDQSSIGNSGASSNIEGSNQNNTNNSTATNSNGISAINGNQTLSSRNKKPKTKNDETGKVRKRVLRACDQCNHLRTKCDGEKPCGHCRELSLDCQYLRIPQKRGKASKMYLIGVKKKAAMAEQGQTAQVQIPAPGQQQVLSPPQVQAQQRVPPQVHPGQTSQTLTAVQQPTITQHVSPHGPPHPRSQPGHSPQLSLSSVNDNMNSQLQQSVSLEYAGGLGPSVDTPNGSGIDPGPPSSHSAGSAEHMFSPYGDMHSDDGTGSSASQRMFANKERSTLRFNNFTPLIEELAMESTLFNQGSVMGHHPHHHHPNEPSPHTQGPPAAHSHQVIGAATANRSSLPPPGPPQAPPLSASVVHATAQPPPAPPPAHLLHSRNNSVNSHSEPSPNIPPFTPFMTPPDFNRFGLPDTRRYPILDNVAYQLLQTGVLSLPLAEDLLETYFAQSTHVLAYLVRRASMLNPTNPRFTEPTLIFAMLLVAAHHTNNPIVVGTPHVRETLIAKLTELTLSHIKLFTDFTCRGTLDDLIALIQIATLASASEFKGTSLRYWASAWDLAKELKLNQEAPELEPESREERRRTWWLLYMVDRHLGLCYNRPLAILDAECSELCRPIDESIWESDIEIVGTTSYNHSNRGVCYTVMGQGIYGYFLPLMAILGLLVDWHHLNQHPLLGAQLFAELDGGITAAQNSHSHQLRSSNPSTAGASAPGQTTGGNNTQISPASTPSPHSPLTHQRPLASPHGHPHNQRNPAFLRLTNLVMGLLDEYERSIMSWIRLSAESNSSAPGYFNAWSDYAMQLVHVLRILTCIPWDPMEILNCPPHSPQMTQAVNYGIDSVKRIRRILRIDPDLRLMPFFFGIYLFQGSLVLLAAVDRAQGSVSAEVVEACESIVRAHEVCIVTLNTEYQRNFRRIMRTTMSMLASDRVDEEERRKQHAVLALYCWRRGGRGLAVQ